MEVITKSYLSEQADAIRFELDEAGRNIVSIGQRLIEVKEMLGHGEFLGWVASEFGWDRKQISRFIQVATEFSNVTTLGHFDKSALYLLAAPSVPEAARDEAKAKASNGRVSHRAAKEIVAKHKPVEPQPVVRPVAPVAVVVPTFDQVFAAIPSIHRKRLDSLPGIKNSARVLYAATLDLCGYNAVVGND